jgi:hypothetical protein
MHASSADESDLKKETKPKQKQNKNNINELKVLTQRRLYISYI